MKLVIRRCPKCGGKHWEKGEEGDTTCLYCGKIEYAPLKKASKALERIETTTSLIKRLDLYCRAS